MMNYPVLEIDLDKIRRNAAAIVGLCHKHDIAVAGVIKGVCGAPEVAKAMLAGGVVHIGDSRIANLERLRANGISRALMLLRIPMLSQTADTVRLCEYSLNSELPVIESLGREAVKLNRLHKVILMVELGDLREGVLPEDAPFVTERILEIPGIILEGVGANLSCYGGVRPTEKNMELLAVTAEKIEQRLGITLKLISGGNSSSLPLVIAGKMPAKINHLRIGEGILLGRETIDGSPLPDTVQDAFVFKAEVIEAGRKPSAPIGEIARDAFGRSPSFADRGIRRRAILGAGRQDVLVEGLKPLLKEVEVLGASSDHLLLDVEDCCEKTNTGSIMEFRLEYGALLSAMTSEYVAKRYVRTKTHQSVKAVTLLTVPTSIGANIAGTELAPAAILQAGLADSLAKLGYQTSSEAPICNSLPYDPALRFDEKLKLAETINMRVAERVGQTLSDGRFPLILGGDHSITAGAVNGLWRAGRHNAGLIFFGAFADFNTVASSVTKNLHGLTLAACAGICDSKFNTACGNFPGIEQENIVIVGLRELDEAERERLRQSRIKVFSMEKIDLIGLRDCMEQAMEQLAHCSDGIHVSLSLDVISPEYAPGVSMPVEGGLNYREAHTAMEILCRSGLPISLDIVEVNPQTDHDGRTVMMAVALSSSLLGKSIL